MTSWQRLSWQKNEAIINQNTAYFTVTELHVLFESKNNKKRLVLFCNYLYKLTISMNIDSFFYFCNVNLANCFFCLSKNTTD